MVADAPEDQSAGDVLVAGEPVLDPLDGFAADAGVMAAGAGREDLRSVEAFPDELGARQRALALPGTAEDIRVVAALGENLHQPPRVPERVEVDRRGHVHAELVLEVALADQALADERFAAWHIAVRLDVPAAHDVPLAPLDQSANPPEQGGLVFLDPPVEDRLVVVEDESVELVAQVGGGAERGHSLSRAFLPFPQPDRIKMSVADKVNSLFHFAFLAGQFGG